MVILFDGECGLCHTLVNFVIDHDPKQQFRFAPLQSEAAASALGALGHTLAEYDSVVLIAGEEILTASDAVLRILGVLGLPWALLSVGWIFPHRFRDMVYRMVAQRRYRWFGRREGCRMPTLADRERFL